MNHPVLGERISRSFHRQAEYAAPTPLPFHPPRKEEVKENKRYYGSIRSGRDSVVTSTEGEESQWKRARKSSRRMRELPASRIPRVPPPPPPPPPSTRQGMKRSDKIPPICRRVQGYRFGERSFLAWKQEREKRKKRRNVAWPKGVSPLCIADSMKISKQIKTLVDSN